MSRVDEWAGGPFGKCQGRRCRRKRLPLGRDTTQGAIMASNDNWQTGARREPPSDERFGAEMAIGVVGLMTLVAFMPYLLT